MKLLVYILIIVAAAGFFIYRQEQTTEPPTPFPAPSAVEGPPLSPISPPSPSEVLTKEGLTETAAPAPLPPVPAPSPIEGSPLTPPLIQPKLEIDPTTLNQIQNEINQAGETLKNIKPQSAPSAVEGRLTQQELYDKAISRVVNFFCQQGNQIRAASGVIISPAGHILTNAHVAEGFDDDFECAIRQGSPARNLAYAKIVMFPQAYTHALTRQEQADNDVSIWKMTRLANGDPLPEALDYYAIDPNYYPKLNQYLVTFSYPSELLGYETILKSLNMFFAETVVNDFDRDLILSSTGLSSQVGSSGGLLVDVYTNQFAGLIFAVSKDEEIAKRKLFSLTSSSINRVVQAETGLALSVFLNN